MTGSKYLSECVNIDMLCKDKLNIIKAPTGSGKTYFALTAIPSSIDHPTFKVVYLIDTINGKEQILQNYNAQPYYKEWKGIVSSEPMWFDVADKVVVFLRLTRWKRESVMCPASPPSNRWRQQQEKQVLIPSVFGVSEITTIL